MCVCSCVHVPASGGVKGVHTVKGCFMSISKGTPNLYFLSEAPAISTGLHGVHEVGTE